MFMGGFVEFMTREGLTHMWWLSFFGGDVVIIEAASLAHARLLAAANVLGRASHFAEGHSISSGLATLIPDNFLRRILSPTETKQLLKLLEPGKYVVDPSSEPEMVPSRRRA
jgi:hypothetical protein